MNFCFGYRISVNLESDSLRLRALQYPAFRYVAIVAFTLPIVIAFSTSILGFSVPLPPCLFQAAFGFPSPSCGLTRSFLALAQGDWQLALSFHLFGPFLVVAFVAIAATALFELVTQQSHAKLYKQVLHLPKMLVFISLFLGYYGVRLWARYTLPDLPLNLEQMQIWQVFLEGTLAL